MTYISYSGDNNFNSAENIKNNVLNNNINEIQILLENNNIFVSQLNDVINIINA